MTSDTYSALVVDKRNFSQLTTQDLEGLLRSESKEVICLDCAHTNVNVFKDLASGRYKPSNCKRCYGAGKVDKQCIEKLLQGRNLSILRKQSGLSTYEQSKKIEMSPRQVYLIENGY